MSRYIAIRSGATALPEGSVARLTKDLFSVSGVFSKAGNQWKVSEHNPQNMSVDIAIGAGVFYGSSVSYHGFTDAVETVVITANSSGNGRIDAIVAYVDKGATPNAGATNVLTFAAVPGTPAGSPVAPDDTAVQAAVGAGNPFLRLANVAVANGASSITNANVTDMRVDVTTVIANLVSALSTITTLKVTNDIQDTNGNEVIGLGATASAVNQAKISNAATGNAPKVEAVGDDTNIDLEVGAKGTGQVKMLSGIYGTPTSYTPSAAATATLLGKNGVWHDIVMPAGNITIAEELKVGQTINLTIKQDSGGSRTVTWFPGIVWFGGTPTLSTGANKYDSFVIRKTGASTYFGWIAGQDAS